MSLMFDQFKDTPFNLVMFANEISSQPSLNQSNINI